MLENFPGIWTETVASGALRYRVAVEGSTKKVTLSVGLDHLHFREHYCAARKGIRLAAEGEKGAKALPGTIGWLVESYCAAMDQEVATDIMAPCTAKQRKVFLAWLRAEVGEYAVDMPPSKLVELRDMKMKTPGAADNFVKTVRAMYSWAMPPRGIVSVNPAHNIKKLNRKPTGATAWSIEDLFQFREEHGPGTMPHLALSLFMFTACRIGDVIHLGRQHESTRNGITSLGWQPEKRGSAFVIVPMLPPLFEATRAVRVIGSSSYLLSDWGKPFASKSAFGNKFRDWVAEAGLKGRSAHGIRKAAAELLALNDATQYEIMAIHGHSSPATSAIYTKGAERAKLAASGMARLAGMAW